MIAVIQRVSKASVQINQTLKGQIGLGVMVLLGIEETDSRQDIEWLSGKIVNLRIFNDQNEVMNKSLLEVDGNVLLVSQFTLHASTKKGNRPSYLKAAKPEISIPLYNQFIADLEILLDHKIETGEFGADMKVELINDGPVTVIIDSKDRK